MNVLAISKSIFGHFFNNFSVLHKKNGREEYHGILITHELYPTNNVFFVVPVSFSIYIILWDRPDDNR